MMGDESGHTSARRASRWRWGTALLVAGILSMSVPLATQASNWGAADSDTANILCTSWNDPNFQKSECTSSNELQFIWVATTLPAGLRNAVIASISQDYDSLPGITAVLDSSFDSGTDVGVYYWLEDPTLAIAFTTCSDTAVTGLNGIRYHMWCRPLDVLYQTTLQVTTAGMTRPAGTTTPVTSSGTPSAWHTPR